MLMEKALKVSTFRERFYELISSSDKPMKDFSKDLHVSNQTISAWKTGTRSPKEPTIIAIANHFGVSVQWLMGFDVPKQATFPALDLNMFCASDQPQTKEARIVSGGMDKLPKDQREQILNVVRAMFSNHPELFDGKDE